jgi:hypothetical protein
MLTVIYYHELESRELALVYECVYMEGEKG